MGRIRELDPHVVNQIAAGEVIERPASVVKELVENALDADARRIDVRLEEGGRALIEVSDDGSGMEAEDLQKAFLPHATSKVTTVEDLLHIGSLGFRGEALASIGSVAHVEITSRLHDAPDGHRVEDRDGRFGDVRPVAASPGTVVRVEGLFGNVPARRKFLRTPATELGHVTTLMGRFAVAFPHVQLRLRQGTRTLLETARDQDRRARIAVVHGEDVARELIEVRGEVEDLVVEGWIGPPSLHRGDARLEQVFLSGRHVRDKTIAHALRRAYEGLLPPGGRRPVAFLFVSCDPARVDVNVHPAKLEVRWRDGSQVHRLVERTLRDALEQVAPGVGVPLRDPLVAPLRDPREAVELAFTEGVGLSAGATLHRAPAASRSHGPASWGAAWDASPSTTTPDAPVPASRGGLRPVGQALGTYLLLEDEDSIVLVDQHALHERVLFERLATRLREGGALEVQRMLVPAVVHLDAADAALLGDDVELLKTLGWHVEPFGEDASFAVHGMPAVLRRPDPEDALREVLQVIHQGRKESVDRTSLLHDALDRMACRAAVMAGDVLHADEVVALLDQAEALNHAHSCPHGRPTRLTLSRAQLERWFHRSS